MFLRDKKQCSGAGEESEIIDVSVFPAFGAMVFFSLGQYFQSSNFRGYANVWRRVYAGMEDRAYFISRCDRS